MSSNFKKFENKMESRSDMEMQNKVQSQPQSLMSEGGINYMYMS